MGREGWRGCQEQESGLRDGQGYTAALPPLALRSRVTLPQDMELRETSEVNCSRRHRRGPCGLNVVREMFSHSGSLPIAGFHFVFLMELVAESIVIGEH